MSKETGTTRNLEQVADQLAIHDVLNLHCRGLDRLDTTTIQNTYWPEAEVDYGSYKGSAHIFAELVVGALDGQYELTRHSLSNTLINFSKNKACCESLVHAGHLYVGGKEEMIFYGRYLDTLEKRGQEWKIIRRQVVMDWSKRVEVQDERNSDAFVEMVKGAHLESDPLYHFLNSL